MVKEKNRFGYAHFSSPPAIRTSFKFFFSSGTLSSVSCFGVSLCFMMWLPFMPISCPVIIVPLRVHLTSSRMDCPIDNAFFFISAVPPTSFYTPSFVSWLENLEGGIFSNRYRLVTTIY